ncbi:triphosphoribosyl-dephospho-CoA synthase MdcB [Rhizobium sp. Root1220]|nr:triphosphoribosyl-dephospho-CoA synthase MdcB [Rhizobium sp. Root1220]
MASTATACLLLELETWPKPGLVSHIDCGSHYDMNSETFRDSAAAIKPFFAALADAGAQDCEMGRLRVIGIEAEAAMRAATGGINTHRGAIFGMGLLCAAAGASASGVVAEDISLGTIVSKRWGHDIIDGPVLLRSHGDRARRRFGAGGARMEAAQGFPTVYQIGLPALRDAVEASPHDLDAARVQTCFALIAVLEDTNLLHRGGPQGLLYAKQLAQDFLDDGGIRSPQWKRRAASIHQQFTDRWLSPGGAADLLAMTLFVDAHERRSI